MKGKTIESSVKLKENNEDFSNLNDSLSKTIENPRAQAYLEHLLNDGINEEDSGNEMELPSYYNEELFRKGQHYFKKYRFIIQTSMMNGLISVLAIPTILNVLMCTGRPCISAKAYRRVVRTFILITTWYKCSPKHRTSKFWLSLEAVRKSHCRSSRICHKLGVGRITQKDMAITQFSFIGFLTFGMESIHLNDTEFFESFTHVWRVLGYLLGIKDEYNICGENWLETRQRLDIVKRKVYEPALENTSDDFYRMCKILFEGLWPIDMGLTMGSILFITKRSANVKGYEYFEFDYPSGKKPDPKQYRYYKDLSWLDRILVFFYLTVVTYLYKYAFVRCLLNFRIWITEQIFLYIPFVAALKFGIKWSYIRVFNDKNVNKI